MKGGPLTHWSYSAWSLMQKCAAAVKYAHIDKLRGPKVPAMERGTAIHAKAEHYLKGNITGMPKELSSLSKHYKTLKAAKPIVEEFWGVNEAWKPVERGWCVMKMDAAVLPTKKMPILTIVDHKTGREYEDHPDQSSLYSSIGFAKYPRVDVIEFEFFYVDMGKVTPYEYPISDVKSNIKYWQEEGRKFLATKKFLPTPSQNACKWCGFRSDKKLANGQPGPCDAWKNLRGAV